MIIRLQKLTELPDARHPHNIAEGFTTKGEMLSPPKLGERFYVGYGWSTSAVQEIIDTHTFRTYNSIYRWSPVESE